MGGSVVHLCPLLPWVWRGKKASWAIVITIMKVIFEALSPTA